MTSWVLKQRVAQSIHPTREPASPSVTTAMGSRLNLMRLIALLAVVQSLVDISLATSLAIVTPCPHCGPSIAPKLVTITAQYQTISTCEPSKTIVLDTHHKRHKPSAIPSLSITPSCSSYAWVSTEIPIYNNHKKTSTLVTRTNQPITFSSIHYTETHTTTLTNHHRTTTKLSRTTIDVKHYCNYNSIGPIAIHGYKGSGLCTDCNPHERGSHHHQRHTVVSCSNRYCTTSHQTWTASSPTRYNTTPLPSTTTIFSSTSFETTTTTTTTSPPNPTNKPPHYPTPTTSSEPTPTETYGDGIIGGDGDGGDDANPSDYVDNNEPPAPSPYNSHPHPHPHKLFKRQGWEQPRGKVMKRSGLLFWGV